MITLSHSKVAQQRLEFFNLNAFPLCYGEKRSISQCKTYKTNTVIFDKQILKIVDMKWL